MRVFNSNATRYAKLELSKSHEINEKEKKKYYSERIMHIEHGSFPPLVMSAIGGLSQGVMINYDNSLDE